MAENVLVTGGAGFIGSHLCEELLKSGKTVVCLDDLSTGRLENLPKDAKNFTFVKGSIMNERLVRETMKKHEVELVFHHAAVVGVDRTLEKPLDVLNVNVVGTINVLEAARANDAKVVNASSSEVYGHPVEMPEREDGVMNAKFPYAVAKLIGEKYCNTYNEVYGLPTVNLRLFNVYGPRQDGSAYGFVVAIFVGRVLAGNAPIVFGDGKQTRDFTYIKDNIEATILAAESEKAEGKTLNLGTGRETSILELANTVIEVSGKKLKAEFGKERPFEILRRCADISLMKEVLDFEAKTSLKQGLEETVSYYSKK
ncbi:MAG: SDR family NAD(P)-dependent oxidoreductase [Candidatus Micrarchaeota archaeon]